MRLGNRHRELEVTIFITCLFPSATLSSDVPKTRPSSIHPDRWVIAFLSLSIRSFLNIFTAEQCIQRTRSKCCRIDSSALTKRHCSKASLIIGVQTYGDEYLGNNCSTALLWQACTFFSVFFSIFHFNKQSAVCCT